MTSQITPADRASIYAANAAGNYTRDSGTGEACLRVPSTGEWLTEQQVLALLSWAVIVADDDDY